MPARKSRSSRTAARPRRRSRTASRTPPFVGRDASPVLEKYPPKDPRLAPRGPPRASLPMPPAAAPAPLSPLGPGPGAGTPLTPPSQPLITLDRAFDVDEFSALLGETSIRVTVPREAVLEVLHRVTEFMGFGIYVYSVTIRPAPGELLKNFVVELQRIDYSAEKEAWVPFVEKGSVGSPSGPGGSSS